MIKLQHIKDFEVINSNILPDQMLINRVDSKYLFNIENTISILNSLKDHYYIVDYGGGLINDYLTKYYDTDNMMFFRMHHNKKNNRLKVRQRTYLNSKLNFFEIKHKINRRTFKERDKFDEGEPTSMIKDFEENYLPYKSKLKQTLITEFKRITLVDKYKKERVTIDFNLKFRVKQDSVKMENLVILELKQNKINRSSKVFSLLRENKIYPANFSKYFVGVSLLNKSVKYNNFKPISLKLKKLKIGEFYD